MRGKKGRVGNNRQKNKTQERQVMQMKMIAHHQSTDAQTVPEQQPPLPTSPTSLIADHDAVRHGVSLQSIAVICPGYVPSQPPVHPQPPCWWGERQKRR